MPKKALGLLLKNGSLIFGESSVQPKGVCHDTIMLNAGMAREECPKPI